MENSFTDIGLIMVIAAVVAMIARRFRIPYAVGLLATGTALAIAGVPPALKLSNELVYSVLLPPLVFEAALYIAWSELRGSLVVVASLATFGVVISASVVAAGMHLLVGWPIAESLLFGSLIAATDPVSVIATFKEAGLHGRLRLLVESESLVNDSTAAILFGLALAFAGDAAPSPGHIAWTLVSNIIGGIGLGALVAGAALLLLGRTSDRVVEITVTTIAAYGSFFLAEHFHASGVLAALTAGLIVGNVGMKGPISVLGREAVITFWDFAAFVANSFVFILIGTRIAQEPLREAIVPSAVAIILVLMGRAAAVYPISAAFSRSRQRVSIAHQHVLFWGGLRGALALALALSLPATLPRRNAVIAVSFAVVAFSIVVQGLTVTPLLRRLGEVGPGLQANEPHARHE
jgi:CPA1 family monovalent cation:H+ antiporter